MFNLGGGGLLSAATRGLNGGKGGSSGGRGMFNAPPVGGIAGGMLDRFQGQGMPQGAISPPPAFPMPGQGGGGGGMFGGAIANNAMAQYLNAQNQYNNAPNYPQISPASGFGGMIRRAIGNRRPAPRPAIDFFANYGDAS